MDTNMKDSSLRDYQAARRKQLKIKQIAVELNSNTLTKLNNICKKYNQSKKDIISFLIDNYKL